MIEEVISIAKTAGKEILTFYRNPALLEIVSKSDNSPVTMADLSSHRLILAGLNILTPDIKVISEEAPVDPALYNCETFWLVDPLDGTREFINEQDHFTVNIALIQNGCPVLGVIYAPALDECYWALSGQGAFLNGTPLFNRNQGDEYSALVSFSHSNQATQDFLKTHHIVKTIPIGSALKFGRLAAGKADIYPRLGPCKLWDIAAGQIIIMEAGCTMYSLSNQKAPEYNLSRLEVLPFVAMRQGVAL